jgi:uracil-DNA glycosylase
MYAMNHVSIEAGWRTQLRAEFEAPYFKKMEQALLDSQAEGDQIYPPASDLFNAFKYTPFNEVRVVILGQDPYHGLGQAHGLCFSVPDGVKPPPSLNNIFKEIQRDLGKPLPATGNLENWARQGVLLLNSILSVKANAAASHRHLGWERFTDAAISAINEHKSGMVFLLWGKFAIQKTKLISPTKHLILTAPHPSPLSAHRGWFGCRHFSKTNEWLIERGQAAIRW